MPLYSRKWNVHVVQSVHVMLGWARSFNHSQKFHDSEIRNNLDLMDRASGYASDERHRFTLDACWPVAEYLMRCPQDADRVRRRMSDGSLEVSPHEASISAHCLCGEELIRSLARRAALERDGFGATLASIQTDIHSFPAAFPSLMAGCGLKYMMVGTNGHPVYGFLKYPPPEFIPRGRALFWWQGPDGRRVLCFHYGGYHEAVKVSDGADFDPSVIETYLQHFEEMGELYPYDSVILFGTGGDAIRSGDFHHSLAGTECIRRWNAESGGNDPDNLSAPRLINGRVEKFFERMEQRYGARIPVFTGGWGGGALLWDTQAQRFAKTGLLARRASARVRATETLSATAAALLGADYPGRAIDEAFQYRLWHDEHDANGTRPLVSDEVKQEWRAIHRQWGVEKLEHPSILLLDDALKSLAAGVPWTGARGLPRSARRGLMVFNPVSRPRTDVVRWRCPSPGSGKTWELTDDATGRKIPTQYVFEEEAGYLLFIARDVPSLGYKTHTLGFAEPAQPGPMRECQSDCIENEFYRVTVGPHRAISSIWDKHASREIVPEDSSFNLYVNGRAAADAGEVRIDNAGPVGMSLRVSASGLPPRTQWLRGQIWLYAGIPRIDIVNEFAVEDAVQEVFYDFPMALDGPLVYTLEGGAGTILTPGRNEFDETKRTHWNTFSFVDVSSAGYGVTLFSPDARQAYLGAQLDEGDPVSDLSRAGILMRLIGGADPAQDWFDNNGGPADNPYQYRFSLTTHSGPVDSALAAAQGWEQMFPLLACELGEHKGGKLSPHGAALWNVPAPLLVSAFKKPWAGEPNEYILRLWNPSDAPLENAPVASDVFAIRAARLNDHLERDLGESRPIRDGALCLDVPAHATTTIRISLTAKGG